MTNKLKGVKGINYVLNKFLAEFGLTARMDDGFYYYTDDAIGYSLYINEDLNKWYMEYVHQLAPDIECDVLLVSILHEVGHHECDYLLSVEEDNYCEDRKQEISKALYVKDITDEEKRKLNYQYFELPDEHEATMWAINYMRDNFNKIVNFWNELKLAVMRFYRLNGVEVC